MKRLLTTRNLFLFYTIGMFVAVLVVILHMGFWCPTSTNYKLPYNEDYVGIKIGEDENGLLDLQERLHEWQINLMSTERELKQLYPENTDSILRKYASPDLPTIYVVTPTYARPVQKAELTRLVQAFSLVKGLRWIVVEDAAVKTQLVGDLLRRSGLKHTHLCATTPSSFKMSSNDPSWRKPRGVLQRNAGLAWLRKNLNVGTDRGVVYFADDDNTYDLQLFEEMRYTKHVSVWPVGLVGYLRYESPILDASGRVISWFTYWKPDRPFALDMAGFAVNLKLLLENPTVEFSLQVSRGEQESYFLDQIVKMHDLEPKANNCTKVLVWHTRTEKASLKNEDKLVAKGLSGSNMKIEI